MYNIQTLTQKVFQNIKNRVCHYKGKKPLKVIITGTPRSGTSFLAGLVVRMGFSPGPIEWLRAANQHNPYGYYECALLMKIEHDLLKKFGGRVMDPPELPENWTSSCEQEKKQIWKIVENGGIELYKGNMLVILSDLYVELFPDAKWIMINRSEQETVRSLKDSGGSMSFEELCNTRKKWLDSWDKSRASSNCLSIRYEDFMDNSLKMTETMAGYLGVSLSQEMLRDCATFFMPRSSAKSK